MIISQNLTALNAYRNLSITQNALSKSMEKLSSGFRINRAADDAAGLAISEKMRGQVNGLNQAVRNAQDGISLIQTAEGALNETHAILQRMRELTVQAANDTNTAADRSQIQKELDNLKSELSRIASTTQFNTKNLLGKVSGTTMAQAKFTFQIGANSGQTIQLSINNMSATGLGIASGTANKINVSGASKTAASISALLSTIDNAIGKVSTERANLGAVQNRLEHTINNLNVASENLTAAESRIRGVDMAQEMMNFTRDQILSQAGTAMLAQANQIPATVLQLLR
ncbi:flagellin [Moorella naiadis]|uniref:flagellin N-terminal helical domain-containing protein n=1 Tax=Moorella naiadis (nom. illeg.) TaxID=3093670 RepID=UPI003D9C848A